MPTEPTDYDYRSMSGITRVARVVAGMAVGFTVGCWLALFASNADVISDLVPALCAMVGGFLGWWLRMYSLPRILGEAIGFVCLAVIVGYVGASCAGWPDRRPENLGLAILAGAITATSCVGFFAVLAFTRWRKPKQDEQT
ncbi:MAG: hypothetical protein NTV86_12395 [Planctomycetota bacterium]|nr:hypothetical protein [Planctomycetota bacterium]